MKRLAIVLVMASALGTAAGGLLAQESQEPATKKKPAREKKEKPLLAGAHAQMAKVCQLSEEQQKKIAELGAQRKNALNAFETENADKRSALQEELKKAKESKDKDATKKASTELAALNAKRGEIVKKSQADIMAVLTPGQKAKWDEYTAMNSLKGRFLGIEFTEDQLAKIKAEYAKLAAEAETGPEKGRSTLLAKLYEKVHKEILTEEQRIDVAVGQVLGPFRKLKLSEDQVAKTKAAYVKHMTGLDTSKRGAREQAVKALREEIRTEILTDEQRQLLAEPKPKGEPKAEAKAEGGK